MSELMRLYVSNVRDKYNNFHVIDGLALCYIIDTCIKTQDSDTLQEIFKFCSTVYDDSLKFQSIKRASCLSQFMNEELSCQP